MTKNEQTLRTFFAQAWNEGRLDAVDAFLASEYRIHSDPGDPWDGQLLSRDGFKERLKISRIPFPDICFEILETVAEDDRVAVSWVMRGTNTGPMGDMAATGKSIEVRGLTIYYFEAGKICGHWQVTDRLAVVQQLGLAF
jgi:steroid delta-isomerase-like uncharacterized protein